MNFDGKEKCGGCDGNGRPPVDPWQVCEACDGIGRVWLKGGPLFDCALQLADRAPGEIVVLASGQRARVQWHIPRAKPETTFVTLFDDFDDVEGSSAKPCSSRLGVRKVESSRVRGDNINQGVGEKFADLDDPIARASRGAREEGLV